jgi:hypothetical protein
MRVYNRAEFMKLPEGVLFCKGKPWAFGDLSIKGESLKSDFTYRQLCWVDAESSEDAVDKLERMLSHGTSEPMEAEYGRDGCFDDKDLFLVFEEDDLMELMAIAQNGIVAMRRAAKRDNG